MKKALLLIASILMASEAYASGCSDTAVNGQSPCGHIIKDSTGSTVRQRKNLQFTGAGVTSVVSATNTTVVTIGGGGTPGGSDTQVQFNDGGSFGGDEHFTYDKTNDVLHVHKLAGDATDGLILESANGTDVGILGAANTANATWYGVHNFESSLAVKKGATSAGYIDFYEDSDNGSNYVRLIGPASTADITLTLPSSDGDSGQYLQTNGSGVMSWATVSAAGDVESVGDCTTGACFGGASGTDLTFDHGSGTYGSDGKITFDGTNNKFTIKTSGITDTGSVYSPILVLEPINTATNHPAWFQMDGIGSHDVTFRAGADGGIGGFVAGRLTTSGGVGLSFYGSNIYPITITNNDGAAPAINNGSVDLGSSSYRWNNVYSEAGNYSAELVIPNGAGGTTVDASGEVTVDTTSKTLNFYNGSAEVVLQPIQSKSVTVPDPTASEDISLFYTDEAITISKIVYVITGSTSATVTIRHHTDRSNAGNEVVTSGTVASSTTTGNVVTSFNDATVPADSFVWLETTALSGTPTSLNATIFFTQDA